MLTKKEAHAPSLQHIINLKAARIRAELMFEARKQKRAKYQQGKPKDVYKPLGEVIPLQSKINEKTKLGFFGKVGRGLGHIGKAMGFHRKGA